eukprot:symbB.v1.2.029884.t2/scaffold3315.1/size59195/3
MHSSAILLVAPSFPCCPGRHGRRVLSQIEEDCKGASPEMYRLNCARQTVEASRFSTLLKQESLTFKEVDFSECNLTNDTLKVVLDLCKHCPKLRILKLFKNQLDDRATERLAEMLRKTPELEELHLSHNLFTGEGVKCLVAAAETFSWDDKAQPLWLRLEQNSVVEPEKLLKELEDEFSVCKREDTVRCTVRTCIHKKKVHLPFFHLQRQIFKSRAELAAEAKAKQAPPAPTRSVSRPEAGAPKPKATVKPCAWGQGMFWFRSHFGKFIFGFLRATLPDENGFIHNLALMTLKDEKLVLGQMVEEKSQRTARSQGLVIRWVRPEALRQ